MTRKNTYFALVILTLLLLISGACNRHVAKFDPSSKIIQYPPPPDTARLQFLTSISNSLQITGKRSGFEQFLFGELPQFDIQKPYGIATHGHKIYICDSGIGGLEIIDLEKNDFKVFAPSGKGQLMVPLNCCLDAAGNLYVADGKRQQVVVFSPSLDYLAAFGEAGTYKPTDVFIWDSLVYVTNLEEHQVIVYDRDSRSKLFSFPHSEMGREDYLASPANLFVNDSGVYVSDMGESKVKIYSHDGTYIRSFGSIGKSMGQFVRNKGIAVDRESNVYVVDAAFENVQIFDKNGQLLMFFGGSYNGPGDMWLPAKVAIDYDNLEYFQKYVDPEYSLEYLVYVTNQYGPDKVGIYGFIKPKVKTK